MELYNSSNNNKKKRFNHLKKLLTKDDILYAAWNNINKSSTAAGVDNIAVREIERSGVADFIKSIKKDLKKNKYQADMVRTIHIPKNDGSQRQLGILTVKDKVVQAAMKLILEPIFEPDFNESSFGFRAFKSTRLASLEVYKWLEAGNNHIFKGDIEDCFGSIPHNGLMDCLKARIKDRHILSIVDSWLKAGLMDNGSVYQPEIGILQGGVISPLLVNIYLDQFDNRWVEIGLKGVGNPKGHLVRYADDFVILSKERIDTGYIRDILKGIELELNRGKSRTLTAKDGFDFLGFYFVEVYPEDRFRGNIHIIPTEGSVQRVIRNIIEATEIKSEMVSPGLVIKRIYQVIDAWLNYYHHTDYLNGTEKIQECFNERIPMYIKAYQSRKDLHKKSDFQNYMNNEATCTNDIIVS